MDSVSNKVEWEQCPMTVETKLVTSTPDREDEDRSEKKPLDTNRPVALSGLTQQHLENQDGASDNGKEEKKG